MKTYLSSTSGLLCLSTSWQGKFCKKSNKHKKSGKLQITYTEKMLISIVWIISKKEKRKKPKDILFLWFKDKIFESRERNMVWVENEEYLKTHSGIKCVANASEIRTERVGLGREQWGHKIKQERSNSNKKGLRWYHGDRRRRSLRAWRGATRWEEEDEFWSVSRAIYLINK